MPTFGSLFAGIGGIDLGLERAGWTGRWQVEWEPFCQRVLAKHWPDVHRVGDVHDAHGADFCPNVADADEVGRRGRAGEWRQGRRAGSADGCPNCLPYVDLIAGGFPCQPVSTAGRRLIQADDRWLWPEFARCIREIRPRYVLVENVPGLLVGGGMDDVLGDLADLGYDAEWESIPAAAVGAPHLRYRVWIVAHDDRRDRGASWPDQAQAGAAGHAIDGGPSDTARCATADTDSRLVWDEPVRLGGVSRAPFAGDDGADGAVGLGYANGTSTDPHATGRGPRGTASESGWWSTEPDVGRVAHGVPARVDRLRALGNAVVPQVVEWIGRRLLEAEEVAA